ncbi:MAG: GNAT family N-acetyltransferase [Patescibacteria group bacterium]
MVIRGRDSFSRVQEEWDHVAHKSSLAIDRFFGSSHILRAWYHTWTNPEDIFCVFHPGARETVPSLYEGGVEGGFGLPLVRVHKKNGSIRILSSPVDDNMWYAPVIGSANEASGQRAAALVAQGDEWDLLILQHVDISRAFWKSFAAYFRSRKYSVEVYPTMQIGSMTLHDRWEDYQKRLKSGFRRNLNKREQYLIEAHGPLTVSVAERKEEVDQAFYEGFSIETMGWKGYTHSAVLQNESSKRYFYELAHAAAGKEALTLAALKSGGFPVSFYYYVRQGDEAYLFKTMYDERYSRFGVGQLGLYKTLKALHQRGVRILNLFGSYVPWHEHWLPTITQYSKIIIAPRRNMLSLVPYRLYAHIKKYPKGYRVFTNVRKWYHVMGIMWDTFKASIQHLR